MLTYDVKTFHQMIEECALQYSDNVLLIDEGKQWTYSEYRDHSVRTAKVLQQHTREIKPGTRGHIAVMMDNRCEYLSLIGASAYAGFTFFALNPLLAGDDLASTIDKSYASLLIVGEEYAETVLAIADQLEHIQASQIIVVGEEGPETSLKQLEKLIDVESAELGDSFPSDVKPTDPLMIVYTSGTTGVPKGVMVSHTRLCESAQNTRSAIPMGEEDVSYLCMPLCHSNGLFGNFVPILSAGGCAVLRRKFSVSRFIDDILKHGVTFWSYVGEPVHYVVNHTERFFNGDEEKIKKELTNHPGNRFRFALGNGASAVDQEKFVRWYGMEHIYEAYGQSEAVVFMFGHPGVPRGSVGEVMEAEAQIHDADGRECPLAEFDDDGNVTNYTEAVGQLVRINSEEKFLGYYDDPIATAKKCINGIFYSGDLGYMSEADGVRYFFFAGRTDDWIRKDGENFSAEPIGEELTNHPNVLRAVAYGIPNIVSSDLVMAALVLNDGDNFDPVDFYQWCIASKNAGHLGEKWVPDYVRVISSFDHTASNKIQIAAVRKYQIDPNVIPGSKVYWRQRGDVQYREFTNADYIEMRGHYAEQERLVMLDNL